MKDKHVHYTIGISWLELRVFSQVYYICQFMMTWHKFFCFIMSCLLIIFIGFYSILLPNSHEHTNIFQEN